MIHRTKNKSINEVVDKVIPKSKGTRNANPLSKEEKLNMDKCTVMQCQTREANCVHVLHTDLYSKQLFDRWSSDMSAKSTHHW